MIFIHLNVILKNKEDYDLVKHENYIKFCCLPIKFYYEITMSKTLVYHLTKVVMPQCQTGIVRESPKSNTFTLQVSSEVTGLGTFVTQVNLKF